MARKDATPIIVVVVVVVVIVIVVLGTVNLLTEAVERRLPSSNGAAREGVKRDGAVPCVGFLVELRSEYGAVGGGAVVAAAVVGGAVGAAVVGRGMVAWSGDMGRDETPFSVISGSAVKTNAAQKALVR